MVLKQPRDPPILIAASRRDASAFYHGDGQTSPAATTAIKTTPLMASTVAMSFRTVITSCIVIRVNHYTEGGPILTPSCQPRQTPPDPTRSGQGVHVFAFQQTERERAVVRGSAAGTTAIGRALG
jgi:hypothetical protein